MLPRALPEQDFFWDDLLEFIEERRVIPIVGSELLTVALLAEAGFKDGQGIPVLPLLVSNESPRAAEVIQAIWQSELGVRITIEPLESKSLIDNVQKLAYTVGLLFWSADYLDPFTFLEVFRTGNNILPTGWSSKDYDAFLEKASFAADAAKRFAILQAPNPFCWRKHPSPRSCTEQRSLSFTQR